MIVAVLEFGRSAVLAQVKLPAQLICVIFIGLAVEGTATLESDRNATASPV